ncbi:alpha/beta fold hydrolase [Hymenobacter persicinus]|uniref:Alpha/beta hydrolase n=1 Tax=Hymenobacter persicinus TaxID=2025506 RepID=A0A4V1ZAX6_9BACT|nr:alpha/beta hydrolase [Hymenobacter persicinus]RYU81019.1 alpha/beta hydrolase [Hymenobacter persicinus]
MPPVFYLIPGLGADERVFRDLQPALYGETHVLSWLPPTSPTEPLPHYAARVAAGIPFEQACFVVGVSFGGIVALEIARLRPRARVVLVSSIPDAASLPPLLRLVRHTGLHRLVPPQALKLFPRVGQWYFGVNSGADYQLFKRILRDTDPVYARWAIRQLLHWDSRGVGAAVRIHGTHDRVLPRGPAPVDHLIPGGTHFMVLSRAAELGQILNELAQAPANP